MTEKTSWIPEQGEMINTPNGEREFIGIKEDKNFYLCWSEDKRKVSLTHICNCSEIKPEPVIERRWVWMSDAKGYTHISNYMADWYAKEQRYKENGWYKSEDYIDVEIAEQG